MDVHFAIGELRVQAPDSEHACCVHLIFQILPCIIRGSGICFHLFKCLPFGSVQGIS